MVDYSREMTSRTVRAVIWIVLASVALILAIYVMAQLAVGSHASRAVRESPLMLAGAVADRLKPVGAVKVDPNAPAASAAAPAPDATTASAPAGAPAAAPAPAVAAPATEVAASADAGKKIFDQVCSVCHKDGVAGAPKTGDKAAWEARVGQGKELLYEHAIKGKGVMPAKGGRMDVLDADVKAAVDYMLAQLK